MKKTVLKWGAGLLMISALSGCSGLASLTQASKPVELFVLTPKSTFDSTLPRLRYQIVVDTPTATAAVNTDQIAVQPTPLQVQYLPGARWIDRAPLIVQALLIESFENTGKVPAVGSSTIGLRADYLIVTDIREFQALVPESTVAEPLLINVRLSLKVVDAFTDRIIASRSFEEIEPSSSDTATDVAAAFDEALGDTMRDAVEWSIREIARAGGPG
jgi:cholesterol transport system auxiliary component